MEFVAKDSIAHTFQGMPKWMKEIMGKVELPSDEGLELVEAINGRELIGASDGLITGKSDEVMHISSS